MVSHFFMGMGSLDSLISFLSSLTGTPNPMAPLILWTKPQLRALRDRGRGFRCYPVQWGWQLAPWVDRPLIPVHEAATTPRLTLCE